MDRKLINHGKGVLNAIEHNIDLKDFLVHYMETKFTSK